MHTQPKRTRYHEPPDILVESQPRLGRVPTALDFLCVLAQHAPEQLPARVPRDGVDELDAAREPLVVHLRVGNVLPWPRRETRLGQHAYSYSHAGNTARDTP